MFKLKDFFGNPFFVYVIGWSIVLIVYTLDWSDLYPKLETNLIAFLVSTFIICFFFGFKLIDKCKFYKLKNAEIDYYDKIVKYEKIVWLLFILNCIFSRSVPLFSYIFHIGDMGAYKNFAIPILHTIIINVNSLLFLISSYCYFCVEKRNNKFLKLLLVSMLIPLLTFNRAELLFMLFGFFICFIIVKFNFKILIQLFIYFIAIMYAFGFLGNLRCDDLSGKYIEAVGEANNNFYKSAVPNEFFWGYIYMSAQIANTQKTINLKKTDDSDFAGLMLECVTPQLISKHLIDKRSDASHYRVKEVLTAESIYLTPYMLYGYTGMWIVFISMMLCFITSLSVVRYNSIVRIPLVCLLSTMSFFSIFTNTLVFSAFVPQLILCFLLRNKIDVRK